MPLQYNNPGTTASTIGNNQINTEYYYRNAIIEALPEMYFSKLSTSIDMPKHMGKTVRAYYYVPLLDDANSTDQGLNASGNSYSHGNIYGSSRDIGTITAALPSLSENGGQVNRVGHTRVERTGTISNLGFYFEFTADSLNFDTDPELYKYIYDETIKGAVKISEDALQKDLLYGASVIHFSGAATKDSEVTGETGATASLVDYEDFQRINVTLNNNLAPKNTTILKGSQLTDTITVNATRFAYCSPDLQIHLEKLADSFSQPAFKHVSQYASQTSVMPDEIGKIGNFRIIATQNMLKWAGVGASVTTNAGYKITSGKYDIYPILVVSGESFSTIGFQGDGKNQKFEIITKMPKEGTVTSDDPYKKKGLVSIQWWYGTLIKRPDWIALIKTVCPN